MAKPQERNFGRELRGLAYIFFAAFLFMSVFSFHPGDPTFNQAVSDGWKVRNLAGQAGSYVAGFFADMFGVGAYLWPMLFSWVGLSRFLPRLRLTRLRWIGCVGLFVCLMVWASHPWIYVRPEEPQAIAGGGWIGGILYSAFSRLLGEAGSFLFWLFATLASLQLVLQLNWEEISKRAWSMARDLWFKYQERRERQRQLREKAGTEIPARRRRSEAKKDRARTGAAGGVEDSDTGEEAAPVLEPFEISPEEDDELLMVLRPFAQDPPDLEPKPAPKPKAKPAPAKPAVRDGVSYPGLDLLSDPPANQPRMSDKVLKEKADRLTVCMSDFNVQGEVQQVIPGPVVTMFEFKPAPGIKVSRIANLSDDIALALKAMAVRIEAPIPGKDSVGIEIPNELRQTVYLKEIFQDPTFAQSKDPLTIALGKDIEGRAQVADLSKMPHLLVAGATGKGKSVGLNCMLMSLIYRCSPDDVKLLLVDPKRIELAIYADLPHLVHPVVTEMAMAKSALEWAVFEMDRRYQSMALLGVRNIEGYNAKLKGLGDDRPEELVALEPMPYLVIIIDELADLMMTAAKEVEQCIVRLAQLARAAGIHLILATQRPSVDVVTGLIKANFPTRISFQTTSRHDSRTILDTVGAEKLLGRGDMLYSPGGSRIRRMHGAYVDEAEIVKAVQFWKEQRPQEFELDFAQWQGDASGNGGGTGGGEAGGLEGDPLYAEAVEFVTDQGKASISLIQRRFRIGFNRAARFIEQMEMDGMLGPQEGSKPRTVLRGRE